MELLGYMAMDQYGKTYHLKTQFPRKELLEIFDRKNAHKMYQDRKDQQQSRHVGYIIAGHWLSVYQVASFKNE